MPKKNGVKIGRRKRIPAIKATLLPEKPIREFKSPDEKKVLELLEWKHPVPPAIWRRIGTEGRSILRRIALNKKHPFRTKAITAIVLANDEEHVQILKAILSDKAENDLSRSVAAISLGMSSHPEARTTLVRFITDAHEFVRAKVVEALGKIGDERSLEALSKAMKDPSSLVRSNARNALNLVNLRSRQIPVRNRKPKQTHQK